VETAEVIHFRHTGILNSSSKLLFGDPLWCSPLGDNSWIPSVKWRPGPTRLSKNGVAKDIPKCSRFKIEEICNLTMTTSSKLSPYFDTQSKPSMHQPTYLTFSP